MQKAKVAPAPRSVSKAPRALEPPKKAPEKVSAEPKAPAEKGPGKPPQKTGPQHFQRLAKSREPGEDLINVQLLIDGSDADGVRAFNERFPVSVVRDLLDPTTEDYYLPIKGGERMKSPRVKSHWLHTRYIREIFIMDDVEL